MQAEGEPGKEKTYFPFTTHPNALDCIDDVPILVKLICLNNSPKPSIILSEISNNASGVESLPVKPVPPVVIITSIFFLFDHSIIVFLIRISRLL